MLAILNTSKYLPDGHEKWRLTGRDNFTVYIRNIDKVLSKHGVLGFAKDTAPIPVKPKQSVLASLQERPPEYNHTPVPNSQMRKAELVEACKSLEIDETGTPEELKARIHEHTGEEDDVVQPQALIDRMAAKHYLDWFSTIGSKTSNHPAALDKDNNLYSVELAAWEDFDTRNHLGMQLLRATVQSHIWDEVHKDLATPNLRTVYAEIVQKNHPTPAIRLDRALDRIDRVEYSDFKSTHTYAKEISKIAKDITESGGVFGYAQQMAHISRGLPRARIQSFQDDYYLNMNLYPPTTKGYKDFLDKLYDFAEVHQEIWDREDRKAKSKKDKTTKQPSKRQFDSSSSFDAKLVCDDCKCRGHTNKDKPCLNKNKPRCAYAPCSRKGHERKECRMEEHDLAKAAKESKGTKNCTNKGNKNDKVRATCLFDAKDISRRFVSAALFAGGHDENSKIESTDDPIDQHDKKTPQTDIKSLSEKFSGRVKINITIATTQGGWQIVEIPLEDAHKTGYIIRRAVKYIEWMEKNPHFMTTFEEYCDVTGNNDFHYVSGEIDGPDGLAQPARGCGVMGVFLDDPGTKRNYENACASTPPLSLCADTDTPTEATQRQEVRRYGEGSGSVDIHSRYINIERARPFDLSQSQWHALTGMKYKISKTTWVVDSGAQMHIVNDKAFFTSYNPMSTNIRTASEGGQLIIEGGGTIELHLRNPGGSRTVFELRRAVYAPNARCNLFALGLFMQNLRGNLKGCFDHTAMWWEDPSDGTIVAHAELKSDLFILDVQSRSSPATTFAAAAIDFEHKV